MRRAALIVLITGLYIGCARPPVSPPIEPVPVPEPVQEQPEPERERPEPERERPAPEPARPEPQLQPRPGGTLRLSLSFAEREALSQYGLIRPGGVPPFAADRVDRWSRLASGTLLDYVEFVSDQRIEAVELLLLGQIDLTPVYGRSATRLLELDSGETRLLRAAGWDRTYVIAFDSDARWTNDPNFRRWFADSIDRVDLVVGLFDGHGAPAWNFRARAGGPVWGPPIVRPFSSTSSPTLTLQYEPSDRAAAAIAARLKALFYEEGLELRLTTDGAEESAELRLVAHQPWSADPVVYLTPLAELTGSAGEEVRQELRAAGDAAAGARDRVAGDAERTLLENALVVPVIRLDAWIAVSTQLEGVQPGLTGQLAVEKIWWNR